jgi:hypothetical protein
MPKPPSLRPLSIKVIATSYGVSAISALYFLLTGIYASQPFTSFHALLVAMLMLGLAFGLWQLSQLARRIAIGWQCYVLVTFLVSIINPTVWRTFTEPRTSEVALGIDPATSRALSLAALAGRFITTVVWGAVVIFFLTKRKSAFVKPTTSTQTSTNL